MEVEGIGGTSLIAFTIRKGDEGKIELLTKALKPAFIQNFFIGQSSPLKVRLRRTDFKIIKCLLSDPRMEISEIAKQISVSSKTVGDRLAKLKENKIVMFNVATDPANMKGYIRFGMFVRLNTKASQKNNKTGSRGARESFYYCITDDTSRKCYELPACCR
ncbi:MAG: winged helix-turn-helix domain-containing protein [Candidatus Eiseniibacteriota bacterium]